MIKEYGSVDILVNCAGFVKDELFVNKPRANWKKEVYERMRGQKISRREEGEEAEKGGITLINYY